MVRNAFILSLLLGTSALAADDTAEYRPDPAYGHDVKMGRNGTWVDHDAVERKPASLLAASSEEGGGEAAYAAAYDSFMQARKTGENRIEKKRAGRWVTKITTPDGFVLLKDQQQNVAVRGPHGRWHLMNAQGEYMVSANSPAAWAKSTSKIASGAKKSKKRTVAAAKKKRPAKVASAPADDQSRRPASIAQPDPPAAPAAEASAPATGAVAPTAAQEQLSPMDALRKLAESSAAQTTAVPAAPAATTPAAAH